MTASADGVVERAEQWGREFDQPGAETRTQAAVIIALHRSWPTDWGPGCTCGWGRGERVYIRHEAHVVQELAGAGLLVALAAGIAS